jgi:hypothetical protein
MKRISPLPALMLLWLLPSVVLAQDAANFIGARVRVLAPRVAERSLVGVLLANDGDGLLVKRDEGGVSVTIPRSAITRLEVSRGRKSKMRAALIGAAAGAGAGAAVGAMTWSEGDQYFYFDKGSYIAVNSVLLGGIGALVGALLPQGEKWQVVSTGRPSIGVLAPGGCTLQVRLALAF